jgi:hypothetical protein
MTQFVLLDKLNLDQFVEEASNYEQLKETIVLYS